MDSSCSQLTPQVLGDPEFSRRRAAGATEIEVQITGEFVDDIRITLWQPDSTIQAEVVRTNESRGTICQQLRQMRAEAPESLEIDLTSARIKLVRELVGEDEQPEVRRLWNEFSSLTIKADLSSRLFAPSRAVRVHAAEGLEDLSVFFLQPDPSVESVAYTESPYASQRDLARWVQDLLDALDLP